MPSPYGNSTAVDYVTAPSEIRPIRLCGAPRPAVLMRTQERKSTTVRSATIGLLAAAVVGSAAVEPKTPRDLTEMSLEELGQIRVTSAARKEQSWFRTAAAVYVVTREEIRRSGALSVPEALRGVPGVAVARIDGNQWAVSVRGFNGRFSNKLLVMVDGRTVYSPLFSGVYWDGQDVPISDIDRIEVVRGPGATMWGVNAVNGVINILTRKSSETQGAMLETGFGTQDGPLTRARYGGALGAGRYRLGVGGQRRRPSPRLSEGGGDDPWRNARADFRFDLPIGDRDSLSVFGTLQRGEASPRAALVGSQFEFGSVTTTHLETAAENLMVRWRRQISDKEEISVQAYYASASRDDALIRNYRDRTLDAEMQYRRTHSRWWESVWGVGARTVGLRLDPGGAGNATKRRDDFQYWSAFAQEEFQLAPDQLTAAVGVKLVESTLGGFTPQPSARLIWTPDASTALWGSISRATRIPAWGERNATSTGGSFRGPNDLRIVSDLVQSPNFSNEVLTAYESGLRLKPHSRVSLDFAGFFNRYSDLRTYQASQPQFRSVPFPHLRLPVALTNETTGQSYGAEAATSWKLTKDWRLDLNHSYLRLRLQGPPGQAGESDEHTTPTHHTTVRSQWRLTRGASLDLSAYRRGRSKAHGPLFRGQQIEAHWRADLLVTWRLADRCSLRLGGQDLFGPTPAEFQPEAVFVGSPRGRNFFGRVEWLF